MLIDVSDADPVHALRAMSQLIELGDNAPASGAKAFGVSGEDAAHGWEHCMRSMPRLDKVPEEHVSTIVDDFQAIDIPLNYAALFMRPVLFASLALAYRVWLDYRRASGGKRPPR